MKEINWRKQANAVFGVVQVKKWQKGVIESILDGRDVLLTAPTAAGKSLTYQLPALVLHEACPKHWTLILEPTISLLRDQVQSMQSRGLAAESWCGLNREEHDSLARQIEEGQLVCLYSTPEQLHTKRMQSLLMRTPPRLVVIDEAHCVIQWGGEFRKAYMRIGKALQNLSDHPVILACSATILPEERDAVEQSLGMRKPKYFTCSLWRSNIHIQVKRCPRADEKTRLKEIRKCLEKYGKKGRVVIFCSTRSRVEMLWNYLSSKLEEPVGRCHAELPAHRRLKYETDFWNGDCRIMVATTAFGMGIDTPDIRLVIHERMPFDIVTYYQQIGRAGRDGKKSHAVLFWEEQDGQYLTYVLQHQAGSEQSIEEAIRKLQSLLAVFQGDECLWNGILRLLGEEPLENGCGHCENCKKRRNHREN